MAGKFQILMRGHPKHARNIQQAAYSLELPRNCSCCLHHVRLASPPLILRQTRFVRVKRSLFIFGPGKLANDTLHAQVNCQPLKVWWPNVCHGGSTYTSSSTWHRCFPCHGSSFWITQADDELLDVNALQLQHFPGTLGPLPIDGGISSTSDGFGLSARFFCAQGLESRLLPACWASAKSQSPAWNTCPYRVRISIHIVTYEAKAMPVKKEKVFMTLLKALWFGRTGSKWASCLSASLLPVM